MMSCIHKIMRRQNCIIRISQNKYGPAFEILKKCHKLIFSTYLGICFWSAVCLQFLKKLTTCTWCWLASCVFWTIVVPSSQLRISPHKPKYRRVSLTIKILITQVPAKFFNRCLFKPLFKNKKFELNLMFQRNASKFAIFYV